MTRQEKLEAMAGVLPEDVMETVNALWKLQDADDCITDILAWDGEGDMEIAEEYFTNLAVMVLFRMKDRLMKYLNCDNNSKFGEYGCANKR